tara:strand:+ start:4436 stop:4909 length:474 start_codon:yes stop_codon:yes gene_type:complete
MELQEKIIKLQAEGFSAGKIAQKLRVKKVKVLEILGDNADNTGLGDTIGKVTEALGLDVVAETVASAVGADDCGCRARKSILNKLFPYKNMNKLTNENYDYLHDFFSVRVTSLNNAQRVDLTRVYNETFNAKRAVSTCSPCYVALIKELRRVYDAAV